MASSSDAGHQLERIRLIGQLPEPISHYADAVRSGNTVWISGMLPVDADGELIGGEDVVAQTEQVFRNLAAVLEHVGASFADVVKVMVFLRDVSDRAAINPVRERHFGDARPASTLVEVSGLAHPQALVEIEAVAQVSRGALL
jgi:reactive intermediate/imine deaminase